MKIDDYIARGAVFDVAFIRAALDGEPWEEGEDPDTEVRRVYLGSVFSCYPSGKFYMPWASSNLERCPVCSGSGHVGAHKSLRVRKRNRSRYQYVMGLGKRGPAWALKHTWNWRRWQHAYLGATCALCHGSGLPEATADEIWRERVEEAFAEAGFALEHGEGDPCDLLAAEYRDKDDADSDEPDPYDPMEMGDAWGPAPR
jgi:hypothetical protein